MPPRRPSAVPSAGSAAPATRTPAAAPPDSAVPTPPSLGPPQPGARERSGEPAGLDGTTIPGRVRHHRTPHPKGAWAVMMRSNDDGNLVPRVAFKGPAL